MGVGHIKGLWTDIALGGFNILNVFGNLYFPGHVKLI